MATSHSYNYDLIVLGAGSGGVRAARISATHGAKVCVVEADRPGGTCVIRGCVPKKLLVYGASFAAEKEDAAGFGWQVGDSYHDFASLIESKDAEIARLEKIYRNLLAQAGASLIEGYGRLKSAHEVEVAGKVISAERILIATGGTPQMTDVPGMNEFAITSDEALDLKTLPETVVIYGSGYIALEFAGIFKGFGAETHLVYRGELPLRGFDEDVRTHIATALEERGIILHSGHTIKSITKTDNVCSVTLDNGEIIECAQIMAATGRVPNVSHLGLEHVGVAQQKNGAIIVDEYSASSIESIYAVGDVTDRINLTPVAIAEGHAFADSMFGQNIRTISHDNVASAVFSQPPIASVGLSEQAAAQKYGALDIYESQFRAMKNTLSGRAEKTYMKLVVEAGTQIVRGVHMMGPDSAEIMQGMAIAVKMGAKKADFDAVIGIHPTAAEEFVTMRTKRNS